MKLGIVNLSPKKGKTITYDPMRICEKPPPCGAICPRHKSACINDQGHEQSHLHYVGVVKNLHFFDLEDQQPIE